MNDQFSYPDVVRMIKDLVAKRGTATLYVRTDRNRVVMIGVRGGEIVTLSSGPKRGEKAIPMLREMSSATVRIEDSAVAFHSEEMPSTQTILAMLSAEAEPRQPETSAAAANTPPSNDRVMETEKVRTVLCHLLGPHLGPISPLICEEVVDSISGPLDAQRLRSIIDRLATEIADPAEALQFAAEAARQLKL